MDGRTVGRALQALAASGEMLAGIEGSRDGGAWLTTTDRRARGYKHDQADGRAGRRASRRSKSSENRAFGSSFLLVHPVDSVKTNQNAKPLHQQSFR